MQVFSPVIQCRTHQIRYYSEVCMLSAIVNAAAVLTGSLIGIFFKRGISEAVQNSIMKAMGLITLLIAIQSAIKTQDTLCVIICLVIGTVLGELIHIEDGLNKGGDTIKSKVLNHGRLKGEVANESTAQFTEGFVTTCILFCVGSMTILGSIEAGINHDYSLIYAKSIMDFISAIVFGAAMGFGVTCTSFFVLIFQGGLVLLASTLSGVLTENIVNEMIAVGGVILIGLGINILELGRKPIRVSNMLPSIFLPPLYLWVTSLF